MNPLGYKGNDLIGISSGCVAPKDTIGKSRDIDLEELLSSAYVKAKLMRRISNPLLRSQLALL